MKIDEQVRMFLDEAATGNVPAGDFMQRVSRAVQRDRRRQRLLSSVSVALLMASGGAVVLDLSQQRDSVSWVADEASPDAYTVPSTSMLPTLEIGDRLAVRELDELRRGMIVTFRVPPLPGVVAPDAQQAPLDRESAPEYEGVAVKRVVGLSGEMIMARNGVVSVNGRQLTEDYVRGPSQTRDFGPVAIPADHVFLLGDDRASSSDSRDFGPLDVNNVLGHVTGITAPAGRIRTFRSD